MRKFKIGDRVENKDFGVGTIAQVDDTEDEPYLVKFDKEDSMLHDCGGMGEDYHYYWLDEEKLTPVSFTKDDLKEGDKLTLRNGATGYYSDDMIIDNLYQGQVQQDLTNSGTAGSELDIVKVERPTYTTIYERKDVREMTVEEISKELGYEVKIIKGD